MAARQELTKEREKLERLKELKATKSAQLQQVTVMHSLDPDTGRWSRTTRGGEFDEFAMENKVKLLGEDVEAAEEEITTADLELRLLRLEARQHGEQDQRDGAAAQPRG